MQKLLFSAVSAALFTMAVSAQNPPDKNSTVANPSTTDEQRVEEVLVIGRPSRFGATKSEISVFAVPRSVTVITEQQFRDRGALTLSNTLDYTAGVTGNAFGLATRGDFTSIRGLDAPEYQDNLQVLFGFYNNARADVYTLEQIEVLKGPASVLYGQAAPGGIVSTVSKIASPDKLASEIVLTAGNFDRYQLSLDTGYDLSGDGNWTGRFVGIYRDAATQVDFVNDDALVVAPSLTYSTDRGALTLLLNYTDRTSDTSSQFLPLASSACGVSDVTISEPNVCAATSGVEANIGLYVGDPNFNRYDTEAITMSLFGRYNLNDRWSVDGTARYRDNEADYDQTWVSFLGDGNPRLRPDGTAIGRSWSSSRAGSTQYAFDFRLRGRFETGLVSHELLAGLNYQNVETFDNSAFFYARPTTFNVFDPSYDGSEVPTTAEFDGIRGRTDDETVATDVYLTDTMYIGDLIVSAGLRLSSVESEDALSSQDDDETPFTFGALYKSASGLNPYVSYAESFRATVGTDVVTGTSLQPRQGEQVELGIKYQPQGGDSYITIAVFELEEDNLVDFVPGGATQPGLSVETDGFEIEALLHWRDFSFDFDYRKLDAIDVDENGMGATRPSLPETTASLWASWEPVGLPVEGMRLGVGVRYASENESNGTAFLFQNQFMPTPNRVVTDGYTVFDALIGYQVGDFEFNLNLRNLTDEEYYSTCLSRGDCFAAERRTIVGTLVRRF
ncbi:MAG: TonB-dependent siderophore receptor [Pseudomonadota bacterium]